MNNQVIPTSEFPEIWTADRERQIFREGKWNSTAGAPCCVAWRGQVICVTRRCAERMVSEKLVRSANSCRACGSVYDISGRWVFIDAAIQRAANAGLRVTVEIAKDEGIHSTYMVWCQQMRCEIPTLDPAKTVDGLISEYGEILEAEEDRPSPASLKNHVASIILEDLFDDDDEYRSQCDEVAGRIATAFKASDR